MGNELHPTSAMAVANWFLEKSWRELHLPPCDQMKLNKLVYYSHGWYLGNYHTELFAEDIEAWPHGPIVRDLYYEFMSFGRRPIDRLGKRIEMKDGEFTIGIPKHNGSLNDFFESVWAVYGKYTGIQLSNMTHQKNEPWTIVAKQYDYDLKAKPTIPPEIISAVFERKIMRARQSD
ncbi:MAG: DUF4065 domain-containing protein [Gammaproteobacteria bacterium]|nr:DUF4065 domain-containing protein [Gammaproteobacteria bacterium]